MDIQAHLAKHDSAIVGIAYEVAKRYNLSRDLARDLAQEGRLELARAHDNGYDHERAALLTYAYRSMRHRMERVAKGWIGRTRPVSWERLDALPDEREDDNPFISSPPFRLAWALIEQRHRVTLIQVMFNPTLKAAAEEAGCNVKTLRKRRDEAAQSFRSFYFGA